MTAGTVAWPFWAKPLHRGAGGTSGFHYYTRLDRPACRTATPLPPDLGMTRARAPGRSCGVCLRASQGLTPRPHLASARATALLGGAP